MKKTGALLLCILIIVTMFTGCSTNTNEEQTIVLEKSDTDLVFDKAASNGDAGYLTSVNPFSNRTGFVEFGKLVGEESMYENSFFGFYDMNTMELVEIGEFARWIVSSHDNEIIMHNRYLYFCALFVADDVDYKEQITLLRMDIRDKKLEVIETIEDETVHPLVHMSKLNENEFIVTFVKKEEDNYTTNTAANTTRVVKYDGVTGESKTIIENKYVYTEGESNSTGILLESVCGMDNMIYAVGRQMEEGEWHYYFYTYDNQGTMISQIEASALEHTMKYDVVHGFYVVGNYFTLVKYESGTQALYKIDDNQVKVVVNHDEKMSFPNMSNFYNSEKTPYIYYSVNQYASGSEHQNTTDSNPVYALNIETGVIKTIKVDIDKERPYLDYILVDENGNLIINLIEEEFGDQVRAYFISEETLQKLLK